MRFWQFGIFTAQADDIDGDGWGGRSILVWGNGSNQEESEFDYNETQISIGKGTGDTFANQALLDVKLAQIKAKLGQIPVLLRVDWWWRHVSNNADATSYYYVHRMYKGWDIGDSSNRYSDRSGAITWYQDAYSPYPGQDRTSVAIDQTPAQAWSSGDWSSLNITPIVERALRDNIDIRMLFMGWPGSAVSSFEMHMKPTLDSNRPHMDFIYMYPVEFYESVGGSIDLASTVNETEDGHYYLGAVERGATGVATQGWVRNYTTATQQVEIFDDHSEWMTPVQRAGTGTGQLDYVTLAEYSTSQLYTAVFYSSTQYEVKAVAYRDNSTSYHPQINADASWRSDTSSNWTSPSGGLTIPAAGWQGANINSGDEFEIGVRGNTTDSAWPADSNDQVEITYDNAGVADATGWRPALGRREQATAAIDVDATSKFFPLRHIVPAEWPIGNKCFIHDQVNIDEGTITSTQERDLGTDTFTGSGLDDLVAPTGNYNGNSNRTYRLQIDANGTPDTFSWSRDGTTTWIATGVNVQSSSFELEDGIWIYWSATTGHTIGDYWTFDADTWGVTVGSLTSGSHEYNVGAIVATTLPIRDLSKAKWSTVNADSGASQSPASRIFLADTSEFTQNDVIFIQQAQNDGAYETATIAAGGVTSTYIDLTTSLVDDYSDGDFCTVTGTGEDAFWMRPVATSTTVEELKQLRFNARIL